jgi:hypothetical protein
VGEARKQMIEQRQIMIKSLAAGHSREQMEAHLDMIVKIQRALDVIDHVRREQDCIGHDPADTRPDRPVVVSPAYAGAASP